MDGTSGVSVRFGKSGRFPTFNKEGAIPSLRSEVNDKSATPKKYAIFIIQCLIFLITSWMKTLARGATSYKKRNKEILKVFVTRKCCSK